MTISLQAARDAELSRYLDQIDIGSQSPDELMRRLEKLLERRWATSIMATDGRTIVAEALSEGLTPAALADITDLMHNAYRMREEPDHAEIGRIVAGLITEYAKSVDRSRT